MKLTVKNWSEFQHYKDRAPPWVKLHKGLLDDFEFQCLPIASRALAPMLWLLASEQMDGSIDGDARKLAFRLRTTEKEITEGLNPLIKAGFLISDSSTLATCLHLAVPETEERRDRVETEAEVLSGKPDASVTPSLNSLNPEANQILDFLNAKTGRRYRPVKSNLRMIAARLKEGATVAECKQVIAMKAREWGADERMEPYLRPATLFNATNFAQYQGALGVPNGN